MTSPRLTPRDVARLGRQVRASERRPQSTGIGERPNDRKPAIRPAMLAVVTTAIPARSGAYPNFRLGKGAGTLLWIDDGVTSLAGTNEPLYNILTVAIPAGPNPIKVAFTDGHLIADLADCPTSSGGTTTTGGGTTTPVGSPS